MLDVPVISGKEDPNATTRSPKARKETPGPGRGPNPTEKHGHYCIDYLGCSDGFRLVAVTIVFSIENNEDGYENDNGAGT